MIDAVAIALIMLGLVFFIAGSVGLLRLPDLHSRLHALTKADNLGLGLLVAGVALLERSVVEALQLLLVWLLVLAASAVDLTLASLLLGLAAAATLTRDLKRGVVLFIAFGLLLAVVWARLRAPDLALAEAAIGAGVAGALLLAALRNEVAIEQPRPSPVAVPPRALDMLILVLGATMALEAFRAADPARLASQAYAALDTSGVSNPVTAVLLNYRAYDTLLELAVILAAVLGVLSLAPAQAAFRPAGPVLSSLVRWLVPLLIVTSGYLLWVGGHAPGGAFQAGATLAAAAVLLRLGGMSRAGLPGNAMLRGVLGLGIAVLCAVGLLVVLAGQSVLQYPPAWAGGLILLIETAATLSIAAALALAYLGGRPQGWDQTTAQMPSTSRGDTA